MKSSFLAAACIGSLALGGCVIAIDADDQYQTNYTNGSDFGSVYAADVGGGAVSFTVRDNGCTDKSFFDVDVHKDGENAFDVGLRRVRQDHCDVEASAGTQVQWTYQELGIPAGAEITILNSVSR